jgi:hypothetical protein
MIKGVLQPFEMTGVLWWIVGMPRFSRKGEKKKVLKLLIRQLVGGI